MPKYKNVAKRNNYKKNLQTKELIVQKSKPLQLLAQTNITLSEFKILDVYLSRIDSHAPQNRTVVFTKGEIEKILGVKRIRKEELLKRLRGLFQIVEIEDTEIPEEARLISLFEQSVAKQGDDGQWIVRLTCTIPAMKYIFNIEKMGYIRYGLRTILNLTSRYSYFLFLYLENNKFRKTWKVEVIDLKKIIGCVEKTYDKYYRFNQKVLSSVQKELKEKAGIYFSYKGIKVGRSTKIIEFKINKLPKELEELKDCEKNQSELTISENKDYTDGIIEDEIEEIDEIVEQPASKIETTKKDESSSKRSLTDILKQCEEAVQENTLLDEVKEKFKYGDLVENNPKYTDYFDFVFRVLCETIGTESDTIRIKGVNKKAQQVILHLAKLKPEEILYVAKKYAETDDVKNPEAYVLTMLYGAVGRPVPKIKKTSYNLNELLAGSGLYIE